MNSGTPPNAPVVLLPLAVEATDAAARDFKIEIAGDAHVNPVLDHILHSEPNFATGCEDTEMIEEQPPSFGGFRALLNQFQEAWDSLPNLEIEPRITVGNFSYSTMPLVTDLEQNGELFASSDIVSAIAGDGEARAAIASRICDPNPNQPDTDSPSNEFLVLDADSSQHMAINRALGGESLVIQGPPGTGKSQTIANLIAALIAGGKRVLFVAEKRAAIEAVTKRLEQVQISDLVMDLHGGVTSRRNLARALNDSLERIATIPAQDYATVHERLEEHRNALNANDDALHEPRSPWNLSVFEMRERLLAIPESAQTEFSLAIEKARLLNIESFRQLASEVQEWVDLGAHELAEKHPDWSHSTVTTTDSAREAFQLASNLAREWLPAARDALFSALEEVDLPQPETVTDWPRTARFLAVASGSRWVRLKAQLMSKEYRTVKEDLGTSQKLPLTSDKVSALEQKVDTLVTGLTALSKITGLNDLVGRQQTNLAMVLQRMASSPTAAANLPRIRELEDGFRRAGVSKIIERIGKDVPSDHAISSVEYAWLRSVLEDIEFDDRRIAAFDSNVHSRHRREFSEADTQHRDSTALRIHRLTAEAITTTMNENPEEAALVRKEAAKKKRHLSLRQLFRRAPNVLPALRPCWTMSPIVAAEVVPADLHIFDVVIFDEASQIPPAEAIGSLARAPQAVIAGDSQQLPPTSFFGRSPEDDNDDDDDLSLIKNIESLLDVAGALLRDKMLQWHYRSRDDRLIAFSNNHIYAGSLTAFPGAIVDTPISNCLIPFRPIIGVTGTRSNPDEVEKVVELVLKHARDTPGRDTGCHSLWPAARRQHRKRT